MIFPGDRRIKITIHAWKRLNESGITDGQEVESLLCGCWAEKAPKVKNKNYKQEKYGRLQETVSYWRNGSYIFTVAKRLDEKTAEPIYLIITFTNQEMTLHNYPDGGFSQRKH